MMSAGTHRARESTIIWISLFFIAALTGSTAAIYTFKGGFSQHERNSATVVVGSTGMLRLEIPKAATPAPEFELKDTAGMVVRLSELRGKVVFLNFWATWCPPCIEEMPAMEKLHQEFGQEGLIILAVNFQERLDRVKQFFSEHNLTFTGLLDSDGKVAEMYQAWALPVSVIINKRGEIAARAIGIKDWYSDEARQLFKQLLSEERGSG